MYVHVHLLSVAESEVNEKVAEPNLFVVKENVLTAAFSAEDMDSVILPVVAHK